MKETFRILPVYTGDVSGVCSALYELGGMVVIHDPSGCNSTYNTHDEIRWYDQDSLIFISGLRERDAVLGNDDKLIKDVCDAAEVYRPEFIALCNSPVPWLSGTDFRGIAKAIEKRTGIPTFSVATNALHDYTVGAGMAFKNLAEKLFGSCTGPGGRSGIKYNTDGCDYDQNADEIIYQRNSGQTEETGKYTVKVNILGMTPLDFADLSEADKLRDILEEDGFEVISCWAVGDTPEQIKNAPGADVNLVVSSAGLPAAKWMQENLQIPFVTGIPAGAAREELSEMLRKTAADGRTRYPGKPEEAGGKETGSTIEAGRMKEATEQAKTGGVSKAEQAANTDGKNEAGNPTEIRDIKEAGGIEETRKLKGTSEPAEIIIIGEPVISKSLAGDIYLKTGRRTAVLCGLESGQECLNLAAGDRAVWGEEEMQNELLKYRDAAAAQGKTLTIAADPLYRNIAPEGTHFIEMPHLAFSGRIYLKRMPKLLSGIADLVQRSQNN